MGITRGHILDQVRAYYVDRFLAEVEACSVAPDVEVLSEYEYVDSNGSLAREGPFDLPYRGDILVVRGDEVIDSILFDTERMVSFEPFVFEWSLGITVEMHPFHVHVAMWPAANAASFAPLLAWFAKWFTDTRASPKARLRNVVHFLSDPTTRGPVSTFHADLGSAAADAFGELLDACAGLGASRVRIGSSVPEIWPGDEG